jgi:isoleucyl-tRNA synthetase
VQDARKAADLDIADRIRLYYTATLTLQLAVESYRDYIMAETLTTDLLNGEPPEGLFTVDDTFDGEKVLIGLHKI